MIAVTNSQASQSKGSLLQRENGGRRQTREAARGRAAQSSWKRGEDQQAAPARDSGVDAVAIPRARAPSSLFK
ncbi:hypothetical protein PF002_g6849 [Phytophthora fragariae]|uniref:Uncharacterized protein n=1 Tax=Phytophthora fragariae TaxID=53985 RepID=A0A6A3FGF2_9STRA|nr:hypothetical protein PF003_g4477 [Phytophthora fragariae]KAE8943487.1 hypothetical protein PF009_g6790 [Phytophthora fragariae]KAE9020945.1 hypothetical protein PF011_g5171 [Phytophthora fragariae]KAE9151059.1 hypothetical protein PF006_g4614 [Phytophthora fragariae]KAE9246189.1 hypothetical protein PF002_g6849 [Phytophthora fragariae]